MTIPLAIEVGRRTFVRIDGPSLTSLFADRMLRWLMSTVTRAR